MKSRYIYILLLLMPGIKSRAQLSAVVLDMETRMPVSKAKVYVNPSGSVTTDRYGRFHIVGNCHSMTFSHAGYESRAIQKSELRDTVWLMPKMHTLDEVVIWGMKPKVRFGIDRITADASRYGKPSSGMTFDLFSAFDKSQKHKSGKDRERYKNILKNY